jgi:hypothetical protein
MSLASAEHVQEEDTVGMRQSTREIAWADIAGIFQRVQLPGTSQAQKENETAPRKGTIFAPFVRQVELPPADSDSESDEEEDLRDESVLARHQAVLDTMKANLTAILEARKKTQERRKSRDKAKKI